MDILKGRCIHKELMENGLRESDPFYIICKYARKKDVHNEHPSYVR